MDEQNVNVVKQAFTAFKQGDIPNLLSRISPEVDWEAVVGVGERVPTGGRRKGLEQVARFFTTLDQTTTFEQFEPQEFVAQGDKVVTLGEYKGTVKSTGRPFSCQFAMVFTVRNGKITKFQEFTDTAAVLQSYNVPVQEHAHA